MAQLTSHAIVRLRRRLAPARDTGAPSPLLIHGNAAPTEALARLLGASETLPAASAVRIVQDRIDRLRDQGGSAAAAGLTEVARPFPSRPSSPAGR